MELNYDENGDLIQIENVYTFGENSLMIGMVRLIEGKLFHIKSISRKIGNVYGETRITWSKLDLNSID